MIKVTDLLTKEEVAVDETQKKLTDFDNATNTIYWTAPEADSEVEHWVEYKTEGHVDDVETKLSTYNNVIKFKYATAVAFDWSKNDPDRNLWKRFVQYAKDHEAELFDENGDWKDNATIGLNDKEFFAN